MTDLRPEDWRTEFTDGDAYPFVEDENANITGLGHQDKETFAAELNRFDREVGGMELLEDELWTAEHITHQWALLDDERLIRAHADAPNAIAVTTLWGQR